MNTHQTLMKSYFNICNSYFSLSGRGVVATRDIARGEFIAEYEGHLITEEELERREEQVESVFRYEFAWKGNYGKFSTKLYESHH